MSKDQGNAGNIDQIRSLIFGDQMQNYESRFNELQEEVGTLRKEFKQSVTELKNIIEGLRSDNNKSLDTLQSHLEKSENTMQDMLNATQNKLDNSIRQLSDDAVKREDLMRIFGEAATRLEGTKTSASTNGKPE
ncbi:MAG: hypothetical protein ACRBF0_13290 [Calditrichia bacterium]